MIISAPSIASLLTPVSVNSLPVTKVKRELLDVLKAMEAEYATITMTRNGEPVGVMMTPDRYESLLETIEILSDKNVLSALKSSQEDFKSGKGLNS